jgi:formamidopyrimidine-DNA glycosylase
MYHRPMPELPDITIYVECLQRLIVDSTLEKISIASPFVLRSVDPSPEQLSGRRVTDVARLGKRIVLELEGELFIAMHLMVAGRLRWRPPGTAPPKRGGLAAFGFDSGALLLTEAGSKRRASIHLLSGRGALEAHDPGGLEPLTSSVAAFRDALKRRNHTVKRALTDPRILSGIGNSYSDEILHMARMSPFKQTAKLDDDELDRLRTAIRSVLEEWTERLREETGEGFPDKVTAFRPEMAVHGRFGEPCPECGSPIQRIVYASNEANYCARCQTGGKLLADRALSRLLKADWPKTVEDLENP